MGLLSVSALAVAQLKMDQVWKDSQANAIYNAEVEGLNAIVANQTATIKEVSDPNKLQDVKVYWPDLSMIAAEAVESNCTIDSNPVGANEKSYSLSLRRKADFSINEDQLKGNVFSQEELIAKSMLRAMQTLDEYYASAALAKLDSFAGTNVFLDGNVFDAPTKNTQIASAKYTQDMYAYLAQVSILNRMRNSYLLDGGSLFQHYFNATANQANGEGKGDAAKFAAIKTYFDMFNFPASGVDASSILVNRSAVSFASRARNASTPVYLGGEINQTRYSVASKNIAGLMYDVYYQLKCETNANGDDEVIHAFRVQGRADLLLNPEGSATNTGVLSFKKV